MGAAEWHFVPLSLVHGHWRGFLSRGWSSWYPDRIERLRALLTWAHTGGELVPGETVIIRTPTARFYWRGFVATQKGTTSISIDSNRHIAEGGEISAFKFTDNVQGQLGEVHNVTVPSYSRVTQKEEVGVWYAESNAER